MLRGLDWKGTESREVLRAPVRGVREEQLSVPNAHCPALTPSVTDRLNMLTIWTPSTCPLCLKFP